MIENQISRLNEIRKELEFDTEIDCDITNWRQDWAKEIRDAISTIQELSAKLAAANKERSSVYYNGGWIPVEDRLPAESLNSVIAFDRYRERCCFVQFANGRWILGDDTDSVDIAAWMPLPEPYRKEV